MEIHEASQTVLTALSKFGKLFVWYSQYFILWSAWLRWLLFAYAPLNSECWNQLLDAQLMVSLIIFAHYILETFIIHIFPLCSIMEIESASMLLVYFSMCIVPLFKIGS